MENVRSCPEVRQQVMGKATLNSVQNVSWEKTGPVTSPCLLDDSKTGFELISNPVGEQ